MKDSKKYTQAIGRIFRSLKQQYGKVEEPKYDEPLESLVYGLISENLTETQAQAVYKRIKEHFVDLNDMRVSRDEEIIDVIGDPLSESVQIASAVQQVLGGVVNAYDAVSLALLEEEGKRQAAKELEKLAAGHEFAAGYCFLTGLGGHTIPLTAGMIEFLRANELVHPEADEAAIRGYLERQISSSEAYRFYYLFRLASEGRLSFKMPKSKDTTARKKKTTKKKVTKK